jgi:hypothetical protein
MEWSDAEYAYMSREGMYSTSYTTDFISSYSAVGMSTEPVVGTASVSFFVPTAIVANFVASKVVTRSNCR